VRYSPPHGVYLASDASSYHSGDTFIIDGAYSISEVVASAATMRLVGVVRWLGARWAAAGAGGVQPRETRGFWVLRRPRRDIVAR